MNIKSTSLASTSRASTSLASTSLALTTLASALCVSGSAMAMAVDTQETVPGRVAHAIATFQSKSKAFVFQEDAQPGTSDAAEKDLNRLAQPQVLIEAIPEPETWTLLAVGLGAIGWVARRRKSTRR